MRKNLQLHDRESKRVQQKRFRRKLLTKRAKLLNARRNSAAFDGEEYTIKAPFAFNIQGKSNRRETLKFLSNFRSNAIERGRAVVLDFADTEHIYPTGGLLLTAEIDRAKRILKDDFSVRIIAAKMPRINAVLKQIGIEQICDADLGEIEELDDDTVRHWRFATGERINHQTTKAFEKFEGRLADNLRKGMWKSISEALANSAQHAYLEPRHIGRKRLNHKRWWMFSQERDGMLTVVVCDLGIGIPRSLPLKWEPRTLSKIYDSIIGQGRDSRSIKAAMEVGASSTGKSHRGRGLPQIWHELRSVNAEGIVILSNKGLLAWDKQSNVEKAHEFNDSIYGTVISWRVPLDD